MHRLDEQIQSITIDGKTHSVTHKYSTLCTRINDICIIDGNYVLTNKFREEMVFLRPPKHGYYMESSGANGIPEFMFGKNYQVVERTYTPPDYQEDEQEEAETGTETHTEDPEHFSSTTAFETQLEKVISYVPLFRLRYSLSSFTAERRQLSVDWERKVFTFLSRNYKSKIIDVYVSTSTAIYDSITKEAHGEGAYMLLMFTAFFILLCLFISIQGNLHTSVSYLPVFGVISICLSTGATFGLISIFRVKVVEPMTLLVFIIASKLDTKLSA